MSTDSASTATNTTKSDAPSKTSSGRPPTLNQLAARMSVSGSSGTPPPSSSQSSRPRLAASVLRTNSQVSLTSTATAATAASVADSTIANPPSTRSASPTSSMQTEELSPLSAGEAAATILNGGGESLTTEKVQKHNADSERMPVGYKNIPSLSAITARMQMHRQLSIDGSMKPPEPETYEDPKTPGIPQKVPEHPLQSSWTMHYDNTKAKAFPPAPAPHEPSHAESEDYEAGLTVVGDFSTVETFCRYFNWLKPPSQLERNSNYHLFKSGIKPMWEDPANANGGKWVITMKNNPQLLDRCWSWLAMALVGEELDEGEEICGAVVSLRSKIDRIQLWIRSKDDVERVNGIGRKLIKLLDVSEADGIGLEFQYNSDDRPPQNRYISIHSTIPQSGFRSSFSNRDLGAFTSPTSGPGDGPPSAGPGGGFGAFGAFNTGRGGWRLGKRESAS